LELVITKLIATSHILRNNFTSEKMAFLFTVIMSCHQHHHSKSQTRVEYVVYVK